MQCPRLSFVYYWILFGNRRISNRLLIVSEDQMTKRKISTKNESKQSKKRKNAAPKKSNVAKLILKCNLVFLIFKFVGVSWSSIHKKWRAQRVFDGKCYYNGLFDNEEETAKASDDLVRKHKMQRVELNFPSDVTIFKNNLI